MKSTAETPEPVKKNPEKIQVLFRSYDILMALGNHPDGLSLREIGHYVKLPRSTVRRIMDTLEEQNIVITAPSTSSYRLGPTLAFFAANIRPFDIAKIARPMLMQLASMTDDSVYLCIITHGMAVVVDLIPGVSPLYSVAAMGSSLPLYATACGKALLATMSEKELESLHRQMKLGRITKNTITDWEKLLVELETIRTTGVALDREEYQIGIIGIAIPLKGPGGEIGSISIIMPKERYQAIGEHVIAFLLNGTQALRWTP